ncbi:TetR/AcrR family transcriptional regulator [Cryptosporangium sp. NPDC048952]|uniref:TetR/AcrR family transcriptional regulator n=1 Tax=Cryptosporangium sp. NPDC048952 TaxID=3363961 RepID=UPI0037226D36
MTSPPSRRRASALSPEQRRETIVRAALPLVAERGAAVTTAEVARAAGIAEGTIFRVFPDKNALLDAVVVEVLRPDHVLAELESIDLDQSLAARLTEAGEALAAHLSRMGAVLGTLHTTGRPLDRRPPPTAGDAADAAPATGAAEAAEVAGPAGYFQRADSARAAAARRAPTEGPSIGRDESQVATAAALSELFEPEREHLRVPPEQAAGIFLSLLFARGRQPRPAADLETTVDVFLYGALDVPAPGARS